VRTRFGHRIHSSTGYRNGLKLRWWPIPVRVDVGPRSHWKYFDLGNIWFPLGINLVPDSFAIV
jgi:hypothetical protein